jgi:hypothetical protein
MPGNGHGELEGRWVSFPIRSVYIPDKERLLLELYGDHVLQGRVVGTSDSGDQTGAYLVVLVDRVGQVIVPRRAVRDVL